jgi:integrase/recombinase XerD
VKKNTFRNYEFILANFKKYFGDIELSSILSEDVLALMTEISGEARQSTKKLRFTLLAAFFQLHQELGRSWLSKPLRQPCTTKALSGWETDPIQDPGKGCDR